MYIGQYNVGNATIKGGQKHEMPRSRAMILLKAVVLQIRYNCVGSYITSFKKVLILQAVRLKEGITDPNSMGMSLSGNSSQLMEATKGKALRVSCVLYCSHGDTLQRLIGKKPLHSNTLIEIVDIKYLFPDMSHIDTGHLFLACLLVWSTIAPVESIIFLELSNQQPLSGIFKVLLMLLSNGSKTWFNNFT